MAPGGVRGRGGIGSLVASTVAYWRAAGLEPPLRVVDPYGPWLSARTPVHFARALAEIAWNARRGRIGLVHAYMAWRGSIARKGAIVHLAARLGLPVVLHAQGSRIDEWFPRLSEPTRRLVRAVFAAADRIIVPGEYWRGVLVNLVGVDASATRVVPNAVPGPRSVPARPAAAGCEILFAGNMTAHKGLPELLQALARADMAALAWRLRIASYGDPRPFVELAAALGIAERVEFLGWLDRDSMNAALSRADVFALPSRNEGLSLAMLEAMAYGCAVVTTGVGATLDAVADGKSALLVPVGDSPALAAALRRLIEEPGLRAALQAGARRRWSEGFEIAEHCRRLLAIYAELWPELATVSAEDRGAVERSVARRGGLL